MLHYTLRSYEEVYYRLFGTTIQTHTGLCKATINPKHTSKKAADFFSQENVNWWKTPTESPDMNPIKNLWHELKEYIRREVKPRNKC